MSIRRCLSKMMQFVADSILICVDGARIGSPVYVHTLVYRFVYTHVICKQSVFRRMRREMCIGIDIYGDIKVNSFDSFRQLVSRSSSSFRTVQQIFCSIQQDLLLTASSKPCLVLLHHRSKPITLLSPGVRHLENVSKLTIFPKKCQKMLCQP